MAGYHNIKHNISGGKNIKRNMYNNGRGGVLLFLSLNVRRCPKVKLSAKEVGATLHDVRQEGKF